MQHCLSVRSRLATEIRVSELVAVLRCIETTFFWLFFGYFLDAASTARSTYCPFALLLATFVVGCCRRHSVCSLFLTIIAEILHHSSSGMICVTTIDVAIPWQFLLALSSAGMMHVVIICAVIHWHLLLAFGCFSSCAVTLWSS